MKDETGDGRGRGDPPRERSQTDAARPAAQPLCITVGPQCCGKTTLLRSMGFGGDGGSVDVCIDDEEDVYLKVRRDTFLNPPLPDAVDHVWIYGKTFVERLASEKETEMKLVLRRLLGKIDEEEFRTKLKQLLHFDGEGPVMEDLIAAVEHHVSSDGPRPIADDGFRVDLYVPEAIFKSPPGPKPVDGARAPKGETKRVRLPALQTAIGRLSAVEASNKVAWGNTNTRPREYHSALKAAQALGRPVRFYVYGGKHLPDVGLRVLLRRNVGRFIETGRYINAMAINSALQRTTSLMESVKKEKEKRFANNINDQSSPEDTELELDIILADRAGFRMNKNRTVCSYHNGANRNAPNRNGNFGRGGRQHFNRYNGGRGRTGGGRNSYDVNRGNNVNRRHNNNPPRDSNSRPESHRGKRSAPGNIIRPPGESGYNQRNSSRPY